MLGALISWRSFPCVAQRFQLNQSYRIVGCERLFEIKAVRYISHHPLRLAAIFLGDCGEGVDQFA